MHTCRLDRKVRNLSQFIFQLAHRVMWGLLEQGVVRSPYVQVTCQDHPPPSLCHCDGVDLKIPLSKRTILFIRLGGRLGGGRIMTSVLTATIPKWLASTVLCHCIQRTAEGCLVLTHCRNVHALCEHAQTTGMCFSEGFFAFLS